MKNKTTMFIIMLFCFFVLCAGITYAYFFVTVNGNEDAKNINATTGSLSLVYTDGNEIKMYKAFPGSYVEKEFTVENNGTFDTYYSINWSEILNEIINDEIVISISYLSNISMNETVLLTNAPIGNVVGPIVNSVPILIDEIQTLTIRVDFIEISSEQNYNQNKTFFGTINVLEENVEFSINGILRNSRGNPIANANVELHSEPMSTVTDENGVFMFEHVTAEPHSINITDGANNILAVDDIEIQSNFNEGPVIDGKIITGNLSKRDINVVIQLSDEKNIGTIDYATWDDYCTGSSSSMNCRVLNDNRRCNNNTEVCADNIASEFVTASTGINYSMQSGSTNGNGLYYITDLTKTEDIDDNGIGERVYFYRGNVTNNYLLFANYCWRIVRTNEDGSIRLLFGGAPTIVEGLTICPQTGSSAKIGSSVYTNEVDDAMYVGYMTGIKDGFDTTESGWTTVDVNYDYFYGTDRAYSQETGLYHIAGELKSGKWNTEDICAASSCPVKNYYTCLSTSATTECARLLQVTNFMDETHLSYKIWKAHSGSFESAHSNNNNSAVKTVVDNWYRTNIDSLGKNTTSLLQDAVYCNDRQPAVGYTGYGVKATYFASYNRLNPGTPTYKCGSNNDKFTMSVEMGNGKLIYPIALITLDELLFAGSYNSNNATTIYATSSESFWTMTAHEVRNMWGAYMRIYDNSRYTSSASNSWNRAVRPVISLKPNVSYASGTGAYNSPYTVAGK